jgi:cbb3-type cytochrome c oxidase subunit III
MTRTFSSALGGFVPSVAAVFHLTCLMLCFFGLQVSANAADEHKRSTEQQTAAAQYQSYCSVCHGEKGNGKSRAQNSLNPPPLDFTSGKASQLSREQMVLAVTNGKAGTAMTAWKSQLKTQQIEMIVDYVRNTFMLASTAADNSRGRNVFSKNCSVCHGEKGDGKSRAQNSLNPPPRDFTSPSAKSELTQQRMITSVTFGRADTAMAGFKTQLSAEDISAVVAYIRSGFMGLDSAPASKAASAVATSKPKMVNMSAPMPKGLKGDAVKGGTFYMANCATCHGYSGDGRGPRAYFINPKPRNFLHSASRQEFNRVKLFEMISDGERGSEMPAWKQVLNTQEIANVAEFVFQQFIQPPTETSKAAK